MRKILIGISNRHEQVVKYLMAFTTVLLIVVAMPKEIQFNFSYKKGKPWPYDNLMAPFDFAVNKSDEELNEERAQVLKSLKPFYRFQSEIATQKLIAFRNELNEAWKNRYAAATTPAQAEVLNKQKTEQLLLAESILNEVFNKGIVSLIGLSQPPNSKEILLIRNNIAEPVVVSDFFTIKTAYNYINSKIKTDRPNDYDFLLPLLENALTYNVVFDEATTQKDARQALESIATSRGLVREGELIIIKGEVVDQIKFKKLESLQFEFKNKAYSYSSKWWLMLGNFILVGAAISMFIIFLALFRKDIYADNKRVLFLLLMIILMCYLFLFARKLNIIDMYLVPVCILPIIVRAFYDTRTALFTHIVTLLIIGFEAPAGFEFMYIQTIAGMVAIFTIVSFSNRSQFFITVLLIFLTYAITFIGVTIVQEANLRNIDWMNLKWFLGNAVITLFAFPLIFVFEKLFGFLSDVTLLELADSNAPLLRELALKAPGTFQHSLQVANLAEAAVTRIGGNPLLVRTGALYHDIGKMEMPVYFIENQLTQVNPHDELSFEESAAIIKSHVTRGIERARKANIPEQIIDFIRTHHGNTRLQYFYQSFIKNFPDEIPDEEDFRYPGPLPFNKETAVLMMADSVEAASRSLNEATSEHIDLLVERIIAKQIEDDQFINSPLTLKDISEVKRIFKKMLYSIYHVRIAYPH